MHWRVPRLRLLWHGSLALHGPIDATHWRNPSVSALSPGPNNQIDQIVFERAEPKTTLVPLASTGTSLLVTGASSVFYTFTRANDGHRTAAWRVRPSFYG
ncbi:hypothetical protein DFH11DRAFT_511023 [Phellopilus nigrolimitatus]|nr:hypothetical protein DFH11DRAFT_511023 [Phellopilus nigrolimitatus]